MIIPRELVDPTYYWDPELVTDQLNPPAPPPVRRPDQSLLIVLMASAEYQSGELGHEVELERTDKYGAVGWCDRCGWAATVDTRLDDDDDIFNGSAMSTPCPGERGVSPPWVSQ